MIIALSVLFGYVVPAFLFYRYVKLSHSKGGIWEESKPEGIDLFFVFVPIINFLIGIITWVVLYPKDKKIINLTNFFNIKK